MTNSSLPMPIADRFRGFLPIVVDVETGGFNKDTDALLEIAVVSLRFDENGKLHPHEGRNWHIEPFEGANLDPKSLEVNGIKPFSPLRIAQIEDKALADCFKWVRDEVKINRCTRAVLVGHNAAFDLGFVHAAAERCGNKRNPFHPFSTLDTVTLGAMAFGQTVLARICKAAGIGWDADQAHSGLYDAQQTASVFCHVFNQWGEIGVSAENQA